MRAWISETTRSIAASLALKYSLNSFSLSLVQVAALRTGELDLAYVPYRDVPSFIDNHDNFTLALRGIVENGIAFAFVVAEFLNQGKAELSYQKAQSNGAAQDL